MSKKGTISSYVIYSIASLSKYKELPSYQFINTETTYWGFNYALNHKSNKKFLWYKKEMLKNLVFWRLLCLIQGRVSAILYY